MRRPDARWERSSCRRCGTDPGGRPGQISPAIGESFNRPASRPSARYASAASQNMNACRSRDGSIGNFRIGCGWLFPVFQMITQPVAPVPTLRMFPRRQFPFVGIVEITGHTHLIDAMAVGERGKPGPIRESDKTGYPTLPGAKAKTAKGEETSGRRRCPPQTNDR